MEAYNSEGFEIVTKGDGSPVTAADSAADAIIFDALSEATPNVPILSEESCDILVGDRLSRSALWIVDPLDGTEEFIHRVQEFTVNLGLVARRRPVVGLVHVPATDRSYFGEVGKGAISIRGERKDASLSVAPLRDGRHPRAVVSRRHLDGETEAFLRRVPRVRLRRVGSSVKFCMLAEGVADLYPRLGPTMEWDTAAGHAVLEAAGGVVRGLDEKPLGYNKASLRNPGFIAVGDPRWLCQLTPTVGP